MFEAWISASMGKALLFSKRRDALLLDAFDHDEDRPCPHEQARNLMRLAGDFVPLGPTSQTPEAIRCELEAAWERDKALTLVLMIVDSRHKIEFRLRSQEIAEKLLCSEETRCEVRHRLLAAVMPETAACQVEWASLGTRSRELLEEAKAKRHAVGHVLAAWQRVMIQNLALDAKETAFLRRQCIYGGGFAVLVDAMTTGRFAAFSDWLKAGDLSTTFSGEVPRHLGEWSKEARRLARQDARNRFDWTSMLDAKPGGPGLYQPISVPASTVADPTDFDRAATDLQILGIEGDGTRFRVSLAEMSRRYLYPEPFMREGVTPDWGRLAAPRVFAIEG